jgi:hypothetical protein
VVIKEFTHSANNIKLSRHSLNNFFMKNIVNIYSRVSIIRILRYIKNNLTYVFFELHNSIFFKNTNKFKLAFIICAVINYNYNLKIIF